MDGFSKTTNVVLIRGTSSSLERVEPVPSRQYTFVFPGFTNICTGVRPCDIPFTVTLQGPDFETTISLAFPKGICGIFGPVGPGPASICSRSSGSAAIASATSSPSAISITPSTGAGMGAAGEGESTGAADTGAAEFADVPAAASPFSGGFDRNASTSTITVKSAPPAAAPSFAASGRAGFTGPCAGSGARSTALSRALGETVSVLPRTGVEAPGARDGSKPCTEDRGSGIGVANGRGGAVP